MDSMETKKKLTTILIHVILIIVSITMLVPFIWMILTAFKTVTEATSVDPFTIFPKIWRKDAFISVINNMNFLLLYKNTLLLIFFRVVCAEESTSISLSVLTIIGHIRSLNANTAVKIPSATILDLVSGAMM